MSECEPEAAPLVFHAKEYDVPEREPAPSSVAPSQNSTRVTPTLSEAVATRVTVPLKVAPAAASPSQLESDEFEPTHPLDINDQAITEIRKLANVKTIVPLQVAPVLVVPPGASSFVGAMVGTDMSLGAEVPVSVLAGRLPKPGSLTEAVVTQGYLDKTGATPQDSVVSCIVSVGASGQPAALTGKTGDIASERDDSGVTLHRESVAQVSSKSSTKRLNG